MFALAATAHGQGIPAKPGDTLTVQVRGMSDKATVLGVPKLAFLQIEGTGLTPVGSEGIRYGDWFHVEARFDAAREESTVTIVLEWDGGASPLALQLSRKTGSDSIYLSRPLRMVYDGAPRLVEIPEL